jgi:predicted RNase H-like HicB family nuclease
MGKTTTIHIQGNAQWRMGKDPETGRYLAVCPSLNLNAMGDTFGELMQCAAEAIALLMVDLYEDDELEKFLFDRGYRPVGALPPRVDGMTPKFDVPFTFQGGVPVGELLTANA